MSVPLLPHPSTPCPDVDALAVEIARKNQTSVDLRFSVTGKIAALRVAPPGKIERRDELWRSTCFELFVRAPESDGYCEFNFATDFGWAAYAFDGYRTGMRPIDNLPTPALSLLASDSHLTLAVSVRLPRSLSNVALALGLSAVLEARDGAISYWAAAHPPGKPDFHHRDCFAVDLAPTLCA